MVYRTLLAVYAVLKWCWAVKSFILSDAKSHCHYVSHYQHKACIWNIITLKIAVTFHKYRACMLNVHDTKIIVSFFKQKSYKSQIMFKLARYTLSFCAYSPPSPPSKVQHDLEFIARTSDEEEGDEYCTPKLCTA